MLRTLSTSFRVFGREGPFLGLSDPVWGRPSPYKEGLAFIAGSAGSQLTRVAGEPSTLAPQPPSDNDSIGRFHGRPTAFEFRFLFMELRALINPNMDSLLTQIHDSFFVEDPGGLPCVGPNSVRPPLPHSWT